MEKTFEEQVNEARAKIGKKPVGRYEATLPIGEFHVATYEEFWATHIQGRKAKAKSFALVSAALLRLAVRALRNQSEPYPR